MTGVGMGATVGRRGALVALLVAVAMTFGATHAELTWSDPSGYANSCLAVGAAVNAPDKADAGQLALFRQAKTKLGPLTVRRSFDSSLPQTFATSAARGDAAAGVRSFVSWKPPRGDFRGAADGKYDHQVTAWAQSVPRTGVYATSFHEPENNMTAAEFVALQRHLYAVVKAANPTIRWGPIYMAYWWDPSAPSHYVGRPADWWPGAHFADFAGLDWYGPDPHPMTTSGSFRTWYSTMEPTGVPLFITEYGQYVHGRGDAPDPLKETERAQAIRTDAAWIHAHPRIRMWMYWQGVGSQGDWRLDDPASQRAWRAVVDAGCSASGHRRGAGAD